MLQATALLAQRNDNGAPAALRLYQHFSLLFAMQGASQDDESTCAHHRAPLLSCWRGGVVCVRVELHDLAHAIGGARLVDHLRLS